MTTARPEEIADLRERMRRGCLLTGKTRRQFLGLELHIALMHQKSGSVFIIESGKRLEAAVRALWPDAQPLPPAPQSPEPDASEST